MAIEIERKFLVKGDQWRTLSQGMLYRQGYIATQNLTTVRVRLVGDQGYLTIKGKTDNFSRVEYEYPIPGSDAQEMLETLCDRPLIEKTRYRIEDKKLVWEVDEFIGENEGLIIAEVELTDENQDVELPNWIGQEVTGDPNYYNANLVRHPFSQWS
ncbi:MAG: CYTH domain-containing protein [Coleofasciculus sp. B1-GNL1-01]|uniref:CYTH domain-containing protein n=1 Tax=Coleofasciculus sp. B1-GNL1-01 TaxID=3068484 RepID=UPI0032F452EE